MCALTSTQPRRNLSRGLIASAVLALTLSAQTGALAQTNTPPANTQVIAPKQVGSWTVIGWSQGYCAAERPLPGAAGGGATLQFVLARFQAGYRLALGSQEWELKPQTTFPIELIAHPVLRSDASAVVVGPKLVVIELGADGQFVRKLTTAPMIEVKAAQATFKLPMEGFAEALVEVDSCFGALKRPASNPFAAPEGKPSAALPKSDVPVASAAPADAAPEATAPIKVAVAKIEPAHSPSATASATAGMDNELLEERTFLTVQNDKGRFRLEALVVKPAKADGRLPIALITHGKNAKAAENQALRADMMLPQARDFAARGWLAVVVLRRGYGQSDGLPGVSRGAAYMACENADLARGFEVEADDLDGALKVVAARPDADGSRAIAIGQSLGGGVVLAFAARRPAGLLGVVNVSGGAWRTNGEGNVCQHDDLVAAMATLGARTRIPTLWLYAENDSLFPPELVTRMRDAYAGIRRPRRTADVSADHARWPSSIRRFRRPGEMAACGRRFPADSWHAERKPRSCRDGHEHDQVGCACAAGRRRVSLHSGAEASRRHAFRRRRLLGCQSQRYRRSPQTAADELPREIRCGMHGGHGE